MHWLPNRRAASRTNSGFLHGGRVDRHLVAAGLQQLADVVERADAAADGERHEHLLGRAADHVEHDVAALVAGGDVEEHQLVGPLLLVPRGHLDRVAGVAQVEEVGPLDHAAAVDVQAGNDALGEHRSDAPPMSVQPRRWIEPDAATRSEIGITVLNYSV